MTAEHKTLYLVRHAKSSWKDHSLADIDRPLNKRGRRSAPDMGKRLKDQGHEPDLIVSSPANRAFTTARKIAKQTGYDSSEIVIDKRMYFSGTGGMRELLEELDDRYQKVMIVGHNPAMTGLLYDLAESSVFNMPTCAIAVIGFDMESWSDLYSTAGDLLGYDYPKGSGSFTE